MIHKARSSVSGHICLTFELPAPVWADQVFLVGEFNDWDERATPLAQTRGGWQVTLDLLANRFYEFRYLIDGRWQTDYRADGLSSNGFGSQNSVVNAVLPVAVTAHNFQPDQARWRKKAHGMAQRRFVPGRMNAQRPLQNQPA